MKTTKFLASLALLIFVNISAHAASLDSEIQERLKLIEQDWNSSKAEALIKEIYLPETQIAGEGSDQLFQSPEAVSQLVKGLVKENKHVSLALDNTRQLAPDAALSWIVWTVTPAAANAEPFKMKSLFVWKKHDGKWRITADMFTSGVIAH